MTWGPIRGYDRAEKIGRRKYAAVKGYYADEGSTQNVLDDLYWQPYPEIGGDYRPFCTRVEVRKRGCTPTKDLVLAYYETPRIVGKGTLLWRPDQRNRERDVDLVGQRITGTDRDTGEAYEIVRGPKAFPETTGTFILQTAYYPGNAILNSMFEFRDKINSHSMPRFLNAHAYTLRYITANVTPEGPNGLVYVDHQFRYNPQGWNNWVWIQRLQYKVETVPVLKPDGSLATDNEGNIRTKDKGSWIPGQKVKETHTTVDAAANVVRYYTYEDEEPTSRTLYAPMNMSMFESIVEW